ncbi:MAG: RNA methyltransferase [Bdellovibrionaceae bacterium]|nr:RNA methyltransferase [Pseudobdellovibrionaceae bacterium]
MESERYKGSLAVGLLHYPMLDGQGDIVATNITNFDIHDIARACRVYGVERYYLIHPMREQLMFVERILDHWRVGTGAKHNPKRRTALTMVKTAENLESALRDWGSPSPWIVATHPRPVSGAASISFRELREALWSGQSVFLMFGTGFGMPDDFMRKCTRVLEGIRGVPPDDYRHLSVRSAVSICLDRLCGQW